MQEQCKAHVEACRHEAGRLEKFKSFLEEDAAEQAARVSLQDTWAPHGCLSPTELKQQCSPLGIFWRPFPTPHPASLMPPLLLCMPEADAVAYAVP